MPARSRASQAGHLAARVLGIKLVEHETRERHDAVTRGESVASKYTLDDDKVYYEPFPTAAGFIKSYIPSRADSWHFAKSLLPFLQWIRYYNRIWLTGDLIAGITVGAVVVPQGMAYAKLANLPVEYGLYSSFVGVMIYWFFATSKDITIGPVAVLSTLVGNIIIKTQAQYPQYNTVAGAQAIGGTIAILAGAFVFAIGLFRLGFIVDFIPAISIASFMTGSAISIASGQFAALMGETGFSTRDATYLVIINSLKYLPRSNLNAAMGVTALAMLYIIRSACTFGGKRWPQHARIFFFANTLRTVFVILLYTMISWLVNMNRRSNPAFSILGNVPRGFQHMGVPVINQDLITSIAPELPSAIIVLLIEHIAISKSFGRVNGYVINPSQELIALGITNLFGPFFGAYPATGSFSRTAIKAKAGVRTPIAGLITGIVVLLALYALPAVFFYISNASLAAVIIHAVLDLITSPNVVYGFWLVSPLECLIYFLGVIVTVFTTIEIGIYVTVSVSAGLMLYRIAKAHGDFLGKIRVQTLDTSEPRNLFLPLDRSVDGLNPALPIESPAEGVFIYRFSESFIYPNATHYTDAFVEHILEVTRPTDVASFPRLGDRPWNDPVPRVINSADGIDHRPTLKAVIFDLTNSVIVDVTSTQTLVDIRRQLERHAAPERVEFHLCVRSMASLC